mgnify:CR=1 FL=1
MAMGDLATDLFGLGRAEKALEVLKNLFALKGNRFSYEFGLLAEMDGNPAGFLSSYPGWKMRSLEIRMAKQLLTIYSIPEIFRFLTNILPFVGIREAESDEYFINAVSVIPELRGHGIGSSLLLNAEKKAKDMGLDKCSLCVEEGNEKARSLYEHLGYRVADLISIRRSRKIYRLYRMVKEL